MRAFAQLIEAIRAAPSSSGKVAALADYFCRAEPADAAWALALLTRHPSTQLVKPALLRLWAAEAAAIPLWLIDECHQVAGDLGETLALILPPVSGLDTAPRACIGEPGPDPQGPRPPAPGGSAAPATRLRQLIEDRLLPLSGLDAAAQRVLVLMTWAELDARQRLLWNRLLTGTFRIGVSRAMLARALARRGGIHPAIVEYRMMGGWVPRAEDFRRLVSPETALDDTARPYPFHPLAEPDEAAPSQAPAPDCQIDWDWLGRRLQKKKRFGVAATQCYGPSRRNSRRTAPGSRIASCSRRNGARRRPLDLARRRRSAQNFPLPHHPSSASPRADARPEVRRCSSLATCLKAVGSIGMPILDERREELNICFDRQPRPGSTRKAATRTHIRAGELFEAAVFSRPRARSHPGTPIRPVRHPVPSGCHRLCRLLTADGPRCGNRVQCARPARLVFYSETRFGLWGCRREDAWQRSASCAR